jgi:hypothetical protein
MDSACYEVLARLDLPRLKLISLEDFERGDDSLALAKQNRSRIEYYFTCTPSLPLYIFNHFAEPDSITYLDADLSFFSAPKPVFDEIGDHSIAIIPHRFPSFLREKEQYGIYNVGWLTFRRDENALCALQWWREQCNAWCYGRVEDGRCADQKYLDDWTTRFANVIVLQHKGANLAPWNLANYTIQAQDERVWVDDQPLVFFHFHGLRMVNRWSFYPCLEPYRVALTRPIRQGIFVPYIKTLVQVSRELAPIINNPAPARRQVWLHDIQTNENVTSSRPVPQSLKIGWHILLDTLGGKYIFSIQNQVF